MKFEDYLKLENATEHLRIVLGNLTEANTALSSVLLQKSEAEQNLSAIQEKTDAALSALSLAEKRHKEVSTLTEQKLTTVVQREGELSAKEERSTQIVKHHESLVTQHLNKIGLLQQNGAELLDQNEQYRSINEGLSRVADALRDSISELTSEILARQQYLTAVKEATRDEQDAHELAIQKAKVILQDVQNLTAETEQKNIELAKPLEEREAVIRGKEADMLVYRQRWIDLFAHYFPGVTPPKI